MIDFLFYCLLAIATASLIHNIAQRIIATRNNFGVNGKLIWMDKGKATKPFFNKKFEVLGKPDLMYRIRGGVLAVEYKSRRGPIFKSDIVQAKCAALAARGDGYQITQILVKTETVEQYIELPHNDNALFHEIKDLVNLTREAKKGFTMTATSNIKKCHSCAFTQECKKKFLN